jgi:hypothetical protein
MLKLNEKGVRNLETKTRNLMAKTTSQIAREFRKSI